MRKHDSRQWARFGFGCARLRGRLGRSARLRECGWHSVRVLSDGADCRATEKEVGRDQMRGPLHLLYAGAISPHKGIHHLFEALSRLPRNTFHLTLAGYWAVGFREWLERRYNVPYS